MVRIRLRRVGAKKKPTYRVVVADQRSPRDGRFIESIGHYDPRTDPPTVVIHEDRALHWLSVGAQPSGPVERFFAKLGLADKLKRIHGGESIDSVAAPRAGAPAAPAKAERGKAKAALADVPAEPSLAERAKGAAAAVAAAAEAGLDKAGDLAAVAADKAGDLAATARDKAGDLAERAAEAASDAAEAITEAAEPVVESAVKTAKKVADVVSDAAETALDKAGDLAETALDKAGDLAETARDKAGDLAAAAAEKAADVVEAIADAVTGGEEAAAEAVVATELSGLGLSARVEKALVDAGVTSPAALAALLAEGDDKVLALPGIGAKAVEEIRERLGQAG